MNRLRNLFFKKLNTYICICKEMNPESRTSQLLAKQALISNGVKSEGNDLIYSTFREIDIIYANFIENRSIISMVKLPMNKQIHIVLSYICKGGAHIGDIFVKDDLVSIYILNPNIYDEQAINIAKACGIKMTYCHD